MNVTDIKATDVPDGLRADGVVFHGEDTSTLQQYFDDRRNIVYQKYTKNGLSRWIKIEDEHAQESDHERDQHAAESADESPAVGALGMDCLSVLRGRA